ncbi:MAG: hypothetical protein AAGI25_09470 [Bacteroidota bacterium]
MIICLTTFSSCNTNDDSIDPVDQRLTEGHLVFGNSEDGNTIFVQYFEELPSGEVDLTQGQAFQDFNLLDVFNGAHCIQDVRMAQMAIRNW